MIPLSARVRRIKPSPSMVARSRAKHLQARGHDIIDLTAGEPDFDTPPHFAHAVVAALAAGETFVNLVAQFAFFAFIGALFAYQGLLRLRHARRDGYRLSPAFVQMGAGVVLMNLDVLAPGLMTYGG